MHNELTSKDGVIYVTTQDGKCYKYDHVLKRRHHMRMVDEVRDEATVRREWYRRHVRSRDMPNSKAARADYSDCGKWERMLTQWLDGVFSRDMTPPFPFGAWVDGKPCFRCVVAKRNCKRIAKQMMLVDWRKIGKFVAAVEKNGAKDREKTLADFEISEATYYWRLSRYAEILGFGTSVDMC